MKEHNILIVDDESSNISVLVEILSEKYNLLVATDGITALEIVDSDERVDIILLDIMMPEMDGYEVAYKLKHNKKRSDIPFIFLTAKNDNDSIVRGFKEGAVDYITKPFQKEELLARLKTHLQVYKLQSDLSKAFTQLQNAYDEIRNKEDIMLAQSRQAAMGEMVNMLAHQWRQPLSVIAMSANNILLDIELETADEKIIENGLTDILDKTQKLSSIIDGFSDFYQEEKVPREITADKVIENSLDLIGKSLENHSIKVTTNIKGSIKINTFSNELMQVIINILKNAKEALVSNINNNEKKIFISIKDNKEEVIISICDNAGGIKKEIQDKIFNPYFSTKNEKNGTGLSLYISKTIIENHLQGTLNTYNKENGACFEIQLPYILKQEVEKK